MDNIKNLEDASKQLVTSRRHQIVIDIVKYYFPKRTIIGLRCNEVVAGLGAIHCVTQQEPAINF